MTTAAYSPKKLALLNQASPRSSARKRSLFPSSSPQSNDLGMISELYSDDSEVYSPPFTSPSLSVTPGKDSPNKMKKLAKVACNLKFNSGLDQHSPRRSPRNKDRNNSSVASSLRKSNQKRFLEREKFDDYFVTILSESPGKNDVSTQFEVKLNSNFRTPQKNSGPIVQEVRRSPRSASKREVVIKPNSFYGKAAPILATNQTNRIQGMKCVFRPPQQQSRAKAKLLFEEKPSRKRERSRSMDAIREAKRRKPVFTGVHHAIPKPMKHSPTLETKQESIREKAKKLTDLSRTPYNVKKRRSEGWEYTLRFTKPMRYDERLGSGEKRKFFKTIIPDRFTSPNSSQKEPSSPFVPHKRIKLLDPRKSYLEEKSPDKPKINTSDIQDLIADNDADKFQDKPEVDDILLRLEEDDDDEEKKKELERQMLMNILENSPRKVAEMDSLSDCTASLDLNDSYSGCSRFTLDDGKENNETPPRFFSIFQKTETSKNVLSDVTHKNTLLSKKKWRGVGEDQLQIDAGQKRYGAQSCSECGMIYQAGEAEDEMQHQLFHKHLQTLRHLGWKNENVVGCFGLDTVIMVTGEDPKNWQKKAQEVLAFVDKSLGIITSESSSISHNQKIFMYVSDKRIVGCMVASPLARAYQMISSESDVDICSEESYPVRCGISRMWTLPSHRRKGIASKLLDTVRRNFMYGHILSREDVAFSIPTPDGKRFALKYMDTPNFFVYTGY